MELKKGSQTSRPPRAKASLNHVRNAASQRSSGGRSITESVVDDPDHQTEGSRISSTDANSTLTSSDSTSKEEFIIQVHPEISSVQIPKSVKVMENDDSNDALCKLEEYFRSSSSSASQISDVTHESGTPTVLVLPTHRPPIIQVMDRTGGFDPDRIPASIFAKPTTMMDWSLASNESLFSIQIGKHSFSKDHSFILDLDYSKEFSINEEGSFSLNGLNQSGEMIKSHKLCQPEQVKESGGLEICKEPVSKEEEKIPLHFGLGARISEEPVANRHYRSINDDVKIKIEGFGNGNVIHGTQSKQKPPKSSCACSSCGCPSCRCFPMRSCCCCCYQWPGCSYKCLSCPKCACGSWPSCSRKGCCCCWSDCSCKCLSCPTITCCSWPDCSCKKLVSQGCGLKRTSFTSCCCSSSSNPSTWEYCKCRHPTWSLKTMFCCLASKSSTAKIPS